MKKNVRLISLILVIMFVLSACGAGAPKGFKEIDTQKSQGVTITSYMGSGTVENALKEFNSWAEKQGWKKLSDSAAYSMAGYSGTAFEKGKDMMIIQAYAVAGQTTVMVVVAPKE